MRSILLICLLLCLAGPAFGEGCEILFAARTQWKAVPHDSTECAEYCAAKADSANCWEKCVAGADSAMCWRKGDPLFARRIGFPWPRGENPDSTNDFVVITVTDKSPQHTNDWLGVQREEGGNVVGQRLRRLVFPYLPQAVRDSLGPNGPGRYTTTWPQIKQFIRNNRTGGMGE